MHRHVVALAKLLRALDAFSAGELLCVVIEDSDRGELRVDDMPP